MQSTPSPTTAVLRYCLLLLLSFVHAAANQPGADLVCTVTDFEFSGSGRITLRPDPTPELPYGEIASRWHEGQPRPSVAYASGTVPVVGARLLVRNTTSTTAVLIRGVGPDGIMFPADSVTATAADGGRALVYAPHAATRAFEPGMVCSYKPFVVRWEASADSGATWNLLTESTATVYVTLGVPVDEEPERGYAYMESLFSISCTAANGASSESEVIADVWKELNDLVVQTTSGDTLGFYRHKKVDPQATSAGLIYTKSGVCFAWAHLLIDLLRVHGITRNGAYVVLTAPESAPEGPIDGMLIKQCEFRSPTARSISPNYPYVAAFDPNRTFDLIGPDVFSRPGVAAQGEPDPISLFRFHALVFIDGVYYDPSFGRTYRSTDDFHQMIGGWVVRSSMNEAVTNYDFNGNGRIENRDATMALVSDDPRRCALSISRDDY